MRMRTSEPLATTRAKMLEDPELAALYLEEALAAGDMAALRSPCETSQTRASAA